MPRIYLDNAATSFPKPPQVAGAVFDYMTNGGCNINGAATRPAYNTEEQVFLRPASFCASCSTGRTAKNCDFTKNVTEA